jgi:hypothetical protein
MFRLTRTIRPDFAMDPPAQNEARVTIYPSHSFAELHFAKPTILLAQFCEAGRDI